MATRVPAPPTVEGMQQEFLGDSAAALRELNVLRESLGRSIGSITRQEAADKLRQGSEIIFKRLA